MGAITDYLPADTLVVVVDPQECERSAEALIKRSGEEANLMSYCDLIESLSKFRMVTGTTLASGDQKNIVDLQSTSAEGFALSLDETRTRLDICKDDEIILGETTCRW